jgi:glucose uptake protein
LSVAFPVAFGTALIVSAVVSYTSHPQTSLALLLAGVALLATAIAANITAHVWRSNEKAAAAVKPLQIDPRSKVAPPPPIGPRRGIVLSLIGGLLLGAFSLMVSEATTGDRGVESYAVAILIAGSVLFSSLFYVPFFLAFPVLGPPGQVRGYFKGEKKQHVMGVLSGIVWMTGIVAGLVADGAAAPMQPGRIVQYALSHAAFLVAAAWGIVAWREFKGASYRVTMILAATLVLFLAGLGMVAVAPLYGG